MSAQPEGGGPAFPQMCADALDVGMVHAGMSLRDYFAAKAMQGFIASADYQHPMLGQRNGRYFEQWIAGAAYDYADAMLAEREKAAQS